VIRIIGRRIDIVRKMQRLVQHVKDVVKPLIN
jgi:hypothetical protein